jgi:hypothetical protein
VARQRAGRQRQVETQGFTTREDHGSFNDILKLTDVAWPAVPA